MGNFWNKVMTVGCIRGYNWGGTESLNFPSNQSAMNVNYIGDVTLENSRFDSVVQFSFGIVDCGYMRGAIQGEIIHVGRFLPLLFKVLAVPKKSGKIKLMK